MAFTGDLEQLNIVDIIQLLNTTRKSGTFSVKGSRGESRIIFSNGYIVGASHLNRVRIGTVLVKMNAITREDLIEALQVQKRAGKNRKPLLATLIEQGKLRPEDAAKGLKTLIEMTLVELIGWTKGTFTLDTEAIVVSPECSYPLGKMEQEMSLDSQMILMNALRIFDELERDRLAGKTIVADEEVYADVVPYEGPARNGVANSLLTADDLGLGNIDRLERKIPQAIPVNEIFDPVKIHRQKIMETLAGYSTEEQDAFVSFLEKSSESRGAPEGLSRQGSRTRALILFSEDELLKHSTMTICKAEDLMVFATDGEEELDRIIDQCLKIKIQPLLIFDNPETFQRMLSREKMVSLRQQIKERYPRVSIVQIASLSDYPFILQAFHDGIRAVFPKPSAETRQNSFIKDTIQFLETFKIYINDFFLEQKELAATDDLMDRLRDHLLALRDLDEPSAVSLTLLHSVSLLCERAITFVVHQAELAGEKAVGVFADRNAGPTSVTRLKIPLSKPSLFREVVEKGQFFYGESSDRVLEKHLFEGIGEPLSPTIILLPVKSRGKIAALVYGDFGGKEVSFVQRNVLEILAHSAGLALENTLYRTQISKASQK